MADRKWLWIPAGLVALLFLYMGLSKILGFSPDVTNELFRRIGIWLGMGQIIQGGPIMVGIIELTAAVLLVTRRGQAWGALIAFIVLSVALFLHLLGPIGFVVETVEETWNAEAGELERTVHSDGGMIFVLAVIGWLVNAPVFWLRRRELHAGAAGAQAA